MRACRCPAHASTSAKAPRQMAKPDQRPRPTTTRRARTSSRPASRVKSNTRGRKVRGCFCLINGYWQSHSGAQEGAEPMAQEVPEPSASEQALLRGRVATMQPTPAVLQALARHLDRRVGEDHRLVNP